MHPAAPHVARRPLLLNLTLTLFFSNFGVSNLDVFYFFYFVFFKLLLNKVCLNLVDLHFGANKLYSFLPPVEITLFPLVLIESPSNGPPFFGW